MFESTHKCTVCWFWFVPDAILEIFWNWEDLFDSCNSNHPKHSTLLIKECLEGKLRWPTMVTSLLKLFTSLPGNLLLFQMSNFSTEFFSLLFRVICTSFPSYFKWSIDYIIRYFFLAKLVENCWFIKLVSLIAYKIFYKVQFIYQIIK